MGQANAPHPEGPSHPTHHTRIKREIEANEGKRFLLHAPLHRTHQCVAHNFDHFDRYADVTGPNTQLQQCCGPPARNPFTSTEHLTGDAYSRKSPLRCGWAMGGQASGKCPSFDAPFTGSVSREDNDGPAKSVINQTFP
ncbi:hypothetical protein ZHAS_00019115 [Anopheles sinensis]|uniref:Uncharacterized protein n=1 Tax=Anopheles sinensis TaxID=74873 RepID=A0A084WLG7_ANOSI|nr:hypothetical protein ZHAS_00019115 [Anopheles sinensis]